MATLSVNAPDVQQRVEIAVQHFGGVMAAELREFLACAHYESPIEAIFAAWFWCFECLHSGFPVGSPCLTMLRLSGQHEVECEGERFRLDFVVERRVGHDAPGGIGIYELEPKIAIELDGHDFHERTKEQVTSRNRRDRLLQTSGWVVLHVSGSELALRPYHVAFEIWRQCRWPRGQA